MRERRFVAGKRCPVEGHRHVLVLGVSARDDGAYVTCAIRERERREEWAARNPRRRERPAREEREANVVMPDPDPRWDDARACALAVAEDQLYAPCVVMPARFASRARALASAEHVLREVKGVLARRRVSR